MKPPDGTVVHGIGPFKGREYVWLSGRLCRVGKGAMRRTKPLNHPEVPRSIGHVVATGKAFQDG